MASRPNVPPKTSADPELVRTGVSAEAGPPTGGKGSTPPSNPALDIPGTPSGFPPMLGGYRVIRRLGAGGMGTVFLGEDAGGGQAAIKVLRKTAQTPQTMVRRFFMEAENAGKLRHPHVVAVNASGEQRGTEGADSFLYLVMEYIDGPDLERQVRKRGPMPVEHSLKVLEQVTQALVYAHSQGLVHRDIKPSNVLLRRDGTAYLADLGLARALDETAESGITRAGYTVGTVDFMPPEQARSSRAADARSDIYSLGCLWYYILTGRIPYPEGDLTNKLRAHAQAPLPDPRDSNPTIPAGAVAVLHRMMAKNPEDRYACAAELLEELAKPSLRRENFTNDDMQALLVAVDERSHPAVAVLNDDPESHSGGNVPSGSTQEARLPPSRLPRKAGKIAEPSPASSSPSLDSLLELEQKGAAGTSAERPGTRKSNERRKGSRKPVEAAVVKERPRANLSGSQPMPIVAPRGPRRGSHSIIGDRILAVILLLLVVTLVIMLIWGLNKLDMFLIG